MILEPGMLIKSEIMLEWQMVFGMSPGMYQVVSVNDSYFKVIKDDKVYRFSTAGFIQWYCKKLNIIDYKKEVDKEIANYSMRMKFDPKDMDTLMREYGVETVKMTSGRSVPVPKYPKGGYIGTDWGNVDSHGDIRMVGSFDKTSKISAFLPRAGELITAEKTRFFDNLKKQLTDNKNLNNNLQNGKATNLPRKNPAIKKGLGFTGRTITSRTGPTTIAIGYIGD